MHLKKLELIGFKSFAEKTELLFEPGISAIVGPNGCGKSNIFDSIRWVLGEQSVKALRGSNMEDVIFNGTDNAAALSVAEVSMTFSNDDKIFPVDANEVIITRRIFRSGESQYLLNKTEVRLKDILEVFMGTGIGAEAYSLVEQGKIDLILSSRAEDRRLVFDEASGITKYKAQKKEALRKLDDTENNLLRINDIITEVKRQIGSLERQANKARRYKEVLEELKSKEITLARINVTQIDKQRSGLKQDEEGLKAGQADKNSQLLALEAKISCGMDELRAQELKISEIKNDILNLENRYQRNNELIRLDKERLEDILVREKLLQESIEELKKRLVTDEEKLNSFKKEYENLESIIQEHLNVLKQKEAEYEILSRAIADAARNIQEAKRSILDLASEQAKVKNEAIDTNTHIQTDEARKRRLDIDRAKAEEEKARVEESLATVTGELSVLQGQFDGLTGDISALKNDSDNAAKELSAIVINIRELENLKLSLESQKEFIEKLMLKYQDISEAMNAVVLVDNMPQGDVTGLIIKIKNGQPIREQDSPLLKEAKYSFGGEAKSISLDVEAINNKIKEIEAKVAEQYNLRQEKERLISELGGKIKDLEESHRQIEFQVSGKSMQKDSISQQLDKICDEKNIIDLELSEIGGDLNSLKEKYGQLQTRQEELDRQKADQEQVIVARQELINADTQKREDLLVSLTQTRTELESLRKRKAQDVVTLNILQHTYDQDKDDLGREEEEKENIRHKSAQINTEIENLDKDNTDSLAKKEKQQGALKNLEIEFSKIQSLYKNDHLSLEALKKELEAITNDLYQIKMHEQEISFKYSSLKDKIMQAYRVDLEAITDALEPGDANTLEEETLKLREKLDSYGNVNLVAIDEYDELKKRYDFLSHQQADLLSAKESLQEAISKINKTTKQMFLETFEKICEEFKNYFRLLFNGGDAKLFLLDEQDPLESGIEIIARPPGKKLQNVLLLSGGEKSMTAVALLFAIFKVKPVSFCILDEVDAALDEANVDRFGRMLHEFTKTSQFILITHNKKTIANANIMYGITMEKSGISKIVSVKFSHTQNKTPEPQKEVGEPV
ncbi:MAG: AAA family ATPase [Candidatus Omnitrophica bacterium]|nr:AAA family ATPase [Candidatus Omnitrophota bacterium]MDD5610455.1 AAA family ATPase [Candidatus Omnitrophota bacterium]